MYLRCFSVLWLLFSILLNWNTVLGQRVKIKQRPSVQIKKDFKTGVTNVIGRKRQPGNMPDTVVYRGELELDSVMSYNNPFENARFLKFIEFENKSFLNDANFSSSVFEAESDFRYTNFNKAADFSSTRFIDGDFSFSNFGNRASFNSSIFAKGISFDKAYFYDVVLLSEAIFKGKMSMVAAEGFKAADFSYASFNDTTDFTNIKFDGRVSFKNCSFSSYNNFDNAVFEKTVYFSNLGLSKNSEFNFSNVSFPDTLDFSNNSKINNEIDFTVAIFNDWNPEKKEFTTSPKLTYINLYRTDISKLRLDYIHFKLYFSSKSVGYDNNVAISEDEKNMTYEALLNNFKLHGQTESFKRLDIEYQQFKLNSSHHKFYNWLIKYWWNFGYNKEYIFQWTFYILLLFSFINIFFLEKLNKNIYLIESIPNNLPQFKSLISYKSIFTNVFVFANRFWYSLVYTTAIFFKVTIKIENFKFSHVIGTVYLFVIYVTGLICLAYMANFIIQK